MGNVKKTCYHSEVREAGQIVVDVLSEVKTSKFKKGAPYVEIDWDGNYREYYLDGAACVDAMTNRKGQRLTIEATGGKDDADIIIHACDWTPDGQAPPAKSSGKATAQPPARQQQQPPARQQAAPPPRTNQPPPQQGAQAQQQPAAQRPASREEPPTATRLTQLANLMIKCELAALAAETALFQGRDHKTTDDQHQGHVAMLFIQMTRDNFHFKQPGDHIVDCAPPKPAAAEQPAQ